MTQDRVAGGFRPGGAVSYAAVTARRLGRQPGILTRGNVTGLAPNTTQPIAAAASGPAYGPLDGIAAHLLPSEVNTVFDNRYDGSGQRVQVVESIAGPISPDDIPGDWTHPGLVLLGPVARELTSQWAAIFPDALVGVAAQGWLRSWDAEGHVAQARWHDAEAVLRRADVVVLSKEDVRGEQDYIAELATQARLLVVTEGRNGCTVYRGGTPYPVAPRAAREVDPTGAGDVFAAAFLIRLAETTDVLQAAHFANVVASMSVEATGMAGIPWRSQVEGLELKVED
jgi:sugar/nucleoside kinase (ribokinase family)